MFTLHHHDRGLRRRAPKSSGWSASARSWSSSACTKSRWSRQSTESRERSWANWDTSPQQWEPGEQSNESDRRRNDRTSHQSGPNRFQVWPGQLQKSLLPIKRADFWQWRKQSLSWRSVERPYILEKTSGRRASGRMVEKTGSRWETPGTQLESPMWTRAQVIHPGEMIALEIHLFRVPWCGFQPPAPRALQHHLGSHNGSMGRVWPGMRPRTGVFLGGTALPATERWGTL